MSKEGSHGTPESELADRLATRGPTPENLAAFLIGITEGERQLIVSALRCARSERTPIAPPTDDEISAYRDLFRSELDKRMDTKHPSASPSTESHAIALRAFVAARNECAKCGRTPPFPGGTRCQDLQCPLINWRKPGRKRLVYNKATRMIDVVASAGIVMESFEVPEEIG